MTRLSDSYIAAEYDKIADQIFESDSLYRDTLRMARDCRGRVLDIGCGKGILLDRLWRERHEISELDGCDISPRMCELAAERVPTANISVANAENLDEYADESYDFAFMVASLEHVQDHSAALASAARVLRRSGVLVVVVPNREWVLYERWRKNHVQVQPIDDYWFRIDELRSLLDPPGFAVEEVRGVWALFRADWRHQVENAAAAVLPALHRKMKHVGIRCRKL